MCTLWRIAFHFQYNLNYLYPFHMSGDKHNLFVCVCYIYYNWLKTRCVLIERHSPHPTCTAWTQSLNWNKCASFQVFFSNGETLLVLFCQMLVGSKKVSSDEAETPPINNWSNSQPCLGAQANASVIWTRCESGQVVGVLVIYEFDAKSAWITFDCDHDPVHLHRPKIKVFPWYKNKKSFNLFFLFLGNPYSTWQV